MPKRPSLYARALKAAQQLDLQEAQNPRPGDLSAEIALLRARIAHHLRTSPADIAELSRALRTLAQLAQAHGQLNKTPASDVATAVENVLTEFKRLLPHPGPVDGLLDVLESPQCSE